MPEETEQKSGHSWSNLKHGLHRYLRDGTLPLDLKNFDRDLTGRLLDMAGGDEKYLPAASVAARTMTAVELLSAYIDTTCRKVVEKGLDIEAAVPVLLPILKVYNSYLEGSRRHLAELGLTPASAARVKQDDDPVTAAKVLSEIRAKEEARQEQEKEGNGDGNRTS